jgi:ribosome-binding protein aMBF1 (putative translation factor)
MTNKKNEGPKGLTNAIPSYQWKDRNDYKKENRDWQKKSKRVTLRILDALDDKNMTQQTLAELLKVNRQKVSKIVKGQENFTFKTVSQLENTLGIILIDIYGGKEKMQHQKEMSLVSSFRRFLTRGT